MAEGTDRRNLLTKGITALLILMFLGGIVFGAMNVLSAEGQYPPEAAADQSLEPLPAGKEAVIAYLNRCLALAVEEKAALDKTTAVSVPDESVSFGEGGELATETFLYAKDGILSKIEEQYSSGRAGYGEDFYSLLWNTGFGPLLIESVESKEEEDSYRFKVLFPAQNNPFEPDGFTRRHFDIAATQNALEYLRKSCAGFAQIRGASVTCPLLEMDASVNRLTNRIDEIAYTKKLLVSADMAFMGEFSQLGTKRVSFEYEEKTAFVFTFPGLTLEPAELPLEKGDVKVIKAFVNADGRTNVRWSSSDPATASVDTDGYVKGHRVSESPVTVTATFDYLEETYAASCEVWVKVPVNKVIVSQKKLTLTAGETMLLTARVKPKDATVKGVLWISNDPAVATVGADGTVTGVGKGETEIYALSKDGYFKQTCKVTVTN